MSESKTPATTIAIDPTAFKNLIDQALEQTITAAVEQLVLDPEWLSKIEQMINQTVTQRTLARISGIDTMDIIREQVRQNLQTVQNKIVESVGKLGIHNTANGVEITVMDQHVAVANTLSAKSIEVVDSAVIKNLAVTGTINVDNRSWDELSESIKQKTLQSVDKEWTEQLVQQVKQQIKTDGIDIDRVTIDGEPLLDQNKLSSNITETSIQQLGTLKNLSVDGEAHVYNTLSVVNRRVGINTREPEMALGLWDEEVSLVAGKLKSNTAYVGTSRNQSLTLGVNRESQVEIDITGLTTVKRLQVGLHKIGHGTELPNYSGTRGDIVFNASVNVNDPVFAWICLGGHKWKVLRAV